MRAIFLFEIEIFDVYSTSIFFYISILDLSAHVLLLVEIGPRLWEYLLLQGMPILSWGMIEGNLELESPILGRKSFQFLLFFLRKTWE